MRTQAYRPTEQNKNKLQVTLESVLVRDFVGGVLHKLWTYLKVAFRKLMIIHLLMLFLLSQCNGLVYKLY